MYSIYNLPIYLPTYQRIYPSISLPIYICTRLPTYPPIKMFPRFLDAKGPGTVSEHLYITSDFEVVNWRTFCAIQLLILVTHLKKEASLPLDMFESRRWSRGPWSMNFLHFPEGKSNSLYNKCHFLLWHNEIIQQSGHKRKVKVPSKIRRFLLKRPPPKLKAYYNLRALL